MRLARRKRLSTLITQVRLPPTTREPQSFEQVEYLTSFIVRSTNQEESKATDQWRFFFNVGYQGVDHTGMVMFN